MGEIDYKPSLHIVEPTSVKIYSSYEKAIFQRYDTKKATLIEWIRYNCDSNQSKGLRYSVYHTQKNLCALINCSRSTLNLWLKELREDRIIAVGKDYNHNCRQNDYSIGPGYFEIVGAGDVSEYEYRTFFAKKQEPAKASSATSVSNITDIVCLETGHSVSDNRTPNSKIYNIHKTKNKTYSSGSARGEPFPDPSLPPEEVFFDVQEKIIAQETPPAPPPADPEPTYHPIPTPPQPQPLHAQELSKDEKREAYARFMENYPRKSGTERERKEAFLIPLRKLGAEELLFRAKKYVEMYEKTGRSKDFIQGPIKFLTEDYKSDELMEFIASSSRYSVSCIQENPISREEFEKKKALKNVNDEIYKLNDSLEKKWSKAKEAYVAALTAEEQEELVERFKKILDVEEGEAGLAWSKEYKQKGWTGGVVSIGFYLYLREQFPSKRDWINDQDEMKILREKKHRIETGEEPTEIEKTKPQEATGSQVFVKLPNPESFLKSFPTTY